ncbi:hypothetical protein ACFLYP_04485 [Chloroflexota bacterium]
MAANKKRAHTPREIETEVLSKSARRCCLCYRLHSDFEIKRGQIAHIDKDPNNPKFNNLAFMCLEHHDEYDSRTSQSKNYTQDEVKNYRGELYTKVEELRDQILIGSASILDNPILSETDSFPPLVEGEVEGLVLMSNNEIPRIIFHFRQSRYYASTKIDDGEKWLVVNAVVNGGYSMRVNVAAWTDRDWLEFMNVLHGNREAWSLQSGGQGRDSLTIRNRDNTLEIIINAVTESFSLFTASFDITEDAKDQLYEYLLNSGFVNQEQLEEEYKLQQEFQAAFKDNT